MNKKIHKILLTLFFCCAVFFTIGLTACGKIDFKYTIDFVVDGEVVASVGTDSKIISMPKNPVKDGFTFDGWFWDKDTWKKEFTLNSIADQPIREENSFRVYAKWKSATEYTVKFFSGSGHGEMPDATMKIGETEALPKNLFVPSNGYVFDGWNTESDGTGASYADEERVLDLCSAGERVSLFAQWRKAVCNVVFEANGGTGSMQSAQFNTYTVVEAACEFTPPAGKRFNGWNTKADGSGVSYGFEKKMYLSVEDGTNIILYAQWEETPKEYYTISFSANGGRGTMPMMRVERDREITVGAATFTPSDSDYAFNGWNTAADGSGKSIAADEPVINLAQANGEITLYAQWVINVYTITFVNSDNSDIFSRTRKAKKGEAITLGEASGFTAPEHCQFECWRLSTDTPVYALSEWRGIDAEETVVDLADVGQTVYVYADWKIAQGIQLYRVSDFEQLQAVLANAVSENTVVVLDNDIVCADSTYIPSCPEFAGTFIGNGHTVKNINIAGDKSGEIRKGGLFGNIASTGKIIELALENVTVTGSYAASFAYKNEGELRGCYVVNGKVNFSGNPLNTDVMACGLVCENAMNGKIIDCYYSGNVAGSLQTGNGSASVAGICYKNQGVMENVYFYGRIDVSGNISAANIFCIQSEGSTGRLGYCITDFCVVGDIVYDDRLDCYYAKKWTKDELYENRYDMGYGNIMYTEMNLEKGSLGYVPISNNDWYHL